jgi:hypothetical protein
MGGLGGRGGSRVGVGGGDGPARGRSGGWNSDGWNSECWSSDYWNWCCWNWHCRNWHGSNWRGCDSRPRTERRGDPLGNRNVRRRGARREGRSRIGRRWVRGREVLSGTFSAHHRRSGRWRSMHRRDRRTGHRTGRPFHRRGRTRHRGDAESDLCFVDKVALDAPRVVDVQDPIQQRSRSDRPEADGP